MSLATVVGLTATACGGSSNASASGATTDPPTSPVNNTAVSVRQSDPSGSASSAGSGTSPSSAGSRIGIVVQADMVSEGSCLLNNQFTRGSTVVLRARVVSGSTGKELDGSQVQSVVAKIPGGQTVKMPYGPHPSKKNPTAHLWVGAWKVPGNYPTGTVDYTIQATAKNGQQTTWHQFQVKPSELTIVQGSSSSS